MDCYTSRFVRIVKYAHINIVKIIPWEAVVISKKEGAYLCEETQLPTWTLMMS